MAPTDLELMHIQVATLFTHDADGRMVRVNEPNGAAAPRFFIGRTAHGNVWRVRSDVDADVARALDEACAGEPLGDQFPESPHGSTKFEEILARVAPVERKEAGPAYRFPDEMPAAPDPVLVTHENSDVLRPHLVAWSGDVGLCDPMLALVIDGRAVSLCGSVRITSVAHEAGVDTAPEFRGMGYASQVVAAWARVVRDRGRIPLYSTSWQNTASQAVAGKLGLLRYGTDLHLT